MYGRVVARARARVVRVPHTGTEIAEIAAQYRVPAGGIVFHQQKHAPARTSEFNNPLPCITRINLYRVFARSLQGMYMVSNVVYNEQYHA